MTSAAHEAGLEGYRVSAPRQIAGFLERLADERVPLHLASSDGHALTTQLWTLDAQRGTLTFSADADDPRVDAMLDGDEAVVIGYLDRVKLQFDVHDLALVRDGDRHALIGTFPHELFRFQRRDSYRVRPLVRSTPTALLRHPGLPEMELSLRVLDVSIGGCALFVPDDVPPLSPGVLMNGARIDLDADTRLLIDLRLQHVTSFSMGTAGTRLGCEFVNPRGDALRALQCFIDQTQKRRKLMALD
ncbi:MAG: flagellar brake protein [Burkholderiaceae bacterium]